MRNTCIKKLFLVFTSAILSICLTALSFAQTGLERIQNQGLSSYQQKKYKANKYVVGVVTGPITGTYVRIGADLADVLNAEDLRVLPIMGKGSLQNMNDILYLKGVDIGIIQADAMTYFTANKIYPNVKDKIHYIAKLYNEEAHLLARKEIKSIEQLKNTKVNFGKIGSGTFVTSKTVFDGLGIEVNQTNYDQRKALELLKKGEIAAMMFVAGKPATNMSSVKTKDSVHLLEIPYEGELQQIYLPSSFSEKDYPNILSEGQRVRTIATSAVMAVYNWPSNTVRYQRVKRFIDRLFSQADNFSKPGRHPKWKELYLAAKVPGWTRFSVAQNILDKNKPEVGQEDAAKLEETFRQFLGSEQLRGSQLTEQQKQKMFKDFLDWSSNTN